MNEKKNIAFVIYSMDSGGAERVVATLANALTKIYNVTIITLIKSESTYPLSHNIFLCHCVESLSLKSGVGISIKQNIQLYFEIKKKLKNRSVNLAIGFMTTSNVLTSLASKSLGIPCIISERSNPYIYTVNAIWKRLVKFSFPKADYLIVQSQLSKDYYSRIIKNDKILNLRNPLSSSLVQEKIKNFKKRDIILNVGRLDANKSQHLLIKAFSNIEHADWKLVFVGDGPLLEDYKVMAEETGKSESIIFTGKTKDIATYYNSSKVFVFTSKSEGFPNALIEAMYFELACISTDCPSGPSELIENGKNGFLIPINDQTALENNLKLLMENSSLCQNFGKRAYITASEYKPETVVKQWNRIIKELI